MAVRKIWDDFNDGHFSAYNLCQFLSGCVDAGVIGDVDSARKAYDWIMGHVGSYTTTFEAFQLYFDIAKRRCQEDGILPLPSKPKSKYSEGVLGEFERGYYSVEAVKDLISELSSEGLNPENVDDVYEWLADRMNEDGFGFCSFKLFAGLFQSAWAELKTETSSVC